MYAGRRQNNGRFKAYDENSQRAEKRHYKTLPTIVTSLYSLHPLEVADEIRVQEQANAGKPPTAWLYPRSQDEPKLLEAIRLSSEDFNNLRPWLTHRDLGQVANLWMGIQLFRVRRKSQALDRFDEVLAHPAVACCEGFFERYPLPVPFNVEGVGVTIPLSRSVAAIYAAVMYQMNGDPEQAFQAVAQAKPCDLVTALKSMYAFNLEQYDKVLQITLSIPNPTHTPFEALALIHRASAIRALGNPVKSLQVITGAASGAAGRPAIMNRLNFEIGRSYASQGNATAAWHQYAAVRWSYADFPGLDEAMAELSGLHDLTMQRCSHAGSVKEPGNCSTVQACST